MFKVNDKKTPYCTPFFSVSIFDYEQLNASWVPSVSICRYKSNPSDLMKKILTNPLSTNDVYISSQHLLVQSRQWYYQNNILLNWYLYC